LPSGFCFKTCSFKFLSYSKKQNFINTQNNRYSLRVWLGLQILNYSLRSDTIHSGLHYSHIPGARHVFQFWGYTVINILKMIQSSRCSCWNDLIFLCYKNSV
jgi:hypothetical protein